MDKEPLKYNIVPFNDVMDVINDSSIPKTWLDEYLACRHDILYNVDIFCNNCRSINENVNFDLFQKAEDSEIVIIPLYLELLEYHNKPQHIQTIVDYYCSKYSNKKVVFYWNHDADSIKYDDIFKRYSNFRLINYNTSSKEPYNIVVPFWTLNTNQYIEKKQYNWGMIASIGNHPCRQKLLRTFYGTANFFFAERLEREQYLKTCSSFVYNFCPRGAGLSSWRFFESFHLNTIPVLFADELILPYENAIDYNNISVRFNTQDTIDYTKIVNILYNLNHKQMLEAINKHRHLFTLKGVQEEIYKRLKGS
jgi:hypothetical protein